ncbi:YheC/YheD family protein [Cytobacillus sp. FJAT-54145]|uniref:YheC/YheD family protein n=1 Tax=Cytobacillus spartinae TaxID=3299023 RepID=A0ABW6K8I0_9BACI
MSNVRGLWSQNLLKKNKYLSKYMVATDIYNRKSLFRFLRQYQKVMIKPSFGEGTIFVHRIEPKGYYEITTNESKLLVKDKEELFDALSNSLEEHKKYLIQEQSFHGNVITRQLITIHKKGYFPGWKVTSMLNESGVYQLSFIKRKLLDYICIKIGVQIGKVLPKCQAIVIEVGVDTRNTIRILDTYLHYPISKWSQYNSLILMSKIAPYLPDTQLATFQSFKHFIQLYKQVILKPCVGQWGQGVVQVTLDADSSFEVHFKRKKSTFTTLKETYRFLEKKFLSKEQYLVQRKIPLASINQNPFDVRVITQRTSHSSPWNITGKLMKVASTGFIITNVAKSLLTIDEGIPLSSLQGKSITSIQDELNQLCIKTSIQLAKVYKSIYILGYDIGINDQGELFIIEVNFVPDISMFHQLEDKKMYQEILRYSQKFKKASSQDIHSIKGKMGGLITKIKNALKWF